MPALINLRHEAFARTHVRDESRTPRPSLTERLAMGELLERRLLAFCTSTGTTRRRSSTRAPSAMTPFTPP